MFNNFPGSTIPSREMDRRHPIYVAIERGVSYTTAIFEEERGRGQEQERERGLLPRNSSIGEWGYMTTDVEKEPPFSSITGRLDEGGEEAKESYYQECMTELVEIDPMGQEDVDRMNRERLQEELRQRIDEYLHQTTRGTRSHRRFDLHRGDGTILRRRGDSTPQNAEFLALGVHGVDRDGKSYQLHFIKKQHGYSGSNYPILRWWLVWLEDE